MVETADIYRETWERMATMGRSLDEATGSQVCHATPEWSVKDVYAHQAGVAADVLAGRLDGVATDPWTARQVAERTDVPLHQILDEWDATAPQLVEAVRALGDDVDPRLLIDQWIHEQDVRHTVGVPGGRDSAAARFSQPILVGGFAHSVQRADLAPLLLELDDTATLVGTGDPVGSLRVGGFELMRAIMGRRSPAEVEAWDWPVDPRPYIDVLFFFGPRRDPLDET
jgi:uncharacterized protein (TIGR03083 family)